MTKFKKHQKIALGILLLILIGLLGYILNNKIIEKAEVPQISTSNQPLSYFLTGEIVQKNPSLNQEGVPLPDSLIIEPGVYKVYGQNYLLEKEGLYRFLDPTKSNQQRIVYRNDTNALLSSIAWISVHGVNDIDKSPKELEKKAKFDKLSLNCGSVSVFAQHLLEEKNIKSRIVTSLSLEEWNSYDNGHTMIEVFLDGKWKVFDLDNNVTFSKNGQDLNFLNLTEVIASGDYSINKIAEDPFYDVGGSTEDRYDYSFYFETTLLDENALRDWYKKSLQVPMVGENQSYYFFDDPHRSRIESYSKNYKYLSREEFMKKFYN